MAKRTPNAKKGRGAPRADLNPADLERVAGGYVNGGFNLGPLSLNFGSGPDPSQSQSTGPSVPLNASNAQGGQIGNSVQNSAGGNAVNAGYSGSGNISVGGGNGGGGGGRHGG